jgi:dTDP-4-amino-4,6-dideoxygalactose transaminase
LAVEELAIFGGPPAFAEPLHVGRPNLGSREAFRRRTDELLDRRWLTNDGPLAREFEERIAELTGVRHCVAVSSGTTALEILARATELKGEVILPSFTFVGTAHAMVWSGLTPRFCDVDPRSHTLDPGRVEALIGPRTAAILAVHLWGRPCDVQALADIAARHRLKLFFDAAHAFASAHEGRMIGRFGDAEVFSFHATKIVQSGEGGALVTDDPELANRARLLRNFGFRDYDDVAALGTNGKFSELSAAMGLTSLESLDEFLAANRRNYEHYRSGLEGLDGLTLSPSQEGWNHQYVVLEVDPEAAGLTRDELRRVLWAEGVLARRYFYPGAHAMEPYRALYPDAGLALPTTLRLAERVLCLPTGSAVDIGEIDAVCAIIRAAVLNANRIRGYLSAAEPAAG